MKEQIRKHTNIERTLKRKIVEIEEVVKSNETDSVKIGLIRGILGKITDKFLDIHQRALTDELTGFVNRWFLSEFLRKVMKSSIRYGHSLTLAIIDLDFFKQVNDNFGHAAGDAVLKGIAEIIKDNIRSSDVVSRYGGDEFIIVFSSTKIADAKIVMERMKTVVAEHDFGGGVRSGISYGLAELKGKHRMAEDLIKDADDALYKSKKHRIDPNAGVKKSRLKKVISRRKK